MITQIRMKNCQSWEDASFSLATDKLNVIEAPNSVGKSVFFKMLKITACPKYYDRVEREELIRWGTQCAMIIYQFDSGGAGAVKVYKEQPVYFYKPAGASGWEQSTEPSSSMLKEAGLLVDQENNFIANIIDTDQELLLVNPNLSSNYSLVKMLVYNGDLEKLKERISTLTPVFRDYEAAVFNKVDFYTKQVAATKFQDVVGLEDSLRVIRTATDLMFKLIDVYNSLQSIRDSVQFYRDYEFLFSVVDLACSMEKICFADLAVMNEPVSVDFAALLQRLESIRLSDIVPRRKPVDVRLLDLLEQC